MWHNVHVRNISSTISESALARVFAGCGRILDCRLCGESNSKLRFAFIAFSSSAEVNQALTLDGFVLEGSALRVLRSKTAVIPVNPTLLPQCKEDIERCSRTVYVANVDPRLTPAAVQAMFEELCGPVICMHQQLNNRRDTQVAFIEFAEASSAMTALGCSGQLIGSRQVRVSPSKTPLKVNTARLSTGSSTRGQGGEAEEEPEGGVLEAEGETAAGAEVRVEAEAEAGPGPGPGPEGAGTSDVVHDDQQEDGKDGERKEWDTGGDREGDADGDKGEDQSRSPGSISTSPPPGSTPAGGVGEGVEAVVAPVRKLSLRNEDVSTETAAA